MLSRAVVLVPMSFALLSGEEWTRFRGPNGLGVAKDSSYPTAFSRDKNVNWRTPVRPGKSSPVLTNRHVFLTGYDDGKLYTQCLDRKTGKLLWEKFELRRSNDLANALNHPAAITPVTDGENVYSFFKDFGLVSYDSSGKVRWKAELAPFRNTMGLGASPIIVGDLVVLVADQVDGLSYIAAFDRRNGEMRWKKARTEGEGWGTPLVYGDSVLTASRGRFAIYRAKEGERLSDSEIATTIVASPILSGNTVFVFGYGSEAPTPFDDRLKRLDKNNDGRLSDDEYGTEAFLAGIGKFVGNRDGVIEREEWDAKQREVIGPNRLSALRIDGDRVTELWRYDKNFTGVIPSPLLYDDLLYVVRNGGILAAFDAKSGEPRKAGRLNGAISGYSSSPVAAGGLIYFPSEEGKIAVVRAGADWETIAVNDLGEPCHATPALSGGSIYLRTSEALYRFQ